MRYQITCDVIIIVAGCVINADIELLDGVSKASHLACINNHLILRLELVFEGLGGIQLPLYERFNEEVTIGTTGN